MKATKPLLTGMFVTVVSSTAFGLEITSPAKSTVVKPGAAVTLRVALSPGEDVQEVNVFTADGIEPASAAGDRVFEGRILVPRNAVGAELVGAFAVLTGGGISFARLELIVDPGPLGTLLVSATPVLRIVGEVVPIDVRGLFEDGVIRDLSAPELGTTYASSGEAVVAVHPTGVMQARSNGTAQITVSNRGKSSTLQVLVAIPQGETNRIPAIAAPPDQTVQTETTVTLSATAADTDGDPLEFRWEQIEGRFVVLSDPTSPTPTFVAPRIEAPQTLEFAVIVRDPKGASSFPVVVRVIVNPRPPPVGDG